MADNQRDPWDQVARMSSFGLTAGVAMLLCGAAGAWLDKRLGTTPIFTIFLFISGGASAVWYGIVSILK
jgi:hypothetical protein